MPEEPLDERARRAVELLEALPARKRVTVIADADVDGTAAAAVLARGLHRVGRRFTILLTRRRDDRLVELIQQRAPSFLITADLGATLVPRLTQLRVPTVILDHHEPKGDGDGDGFVHVNPHLEGEDGSTGASGAAVSYRFAETLLEHHGKSATDLLPYALLGAWGDRYHGAQHDAGLHARLTAEVKQADATHVDWRRWTPDAAPGTPLKQALAGNLDPVIPALKGDAGQAAAVLTSLRIDPERSAESLDDEERARLVNWLSAAMLEEGADPGLLARLLSPRLAFPAHHEAVAGLSVTEVAQRVDAATRQGAEATALSALLGSHEAWDAIMTHLQAYREGATEPVWRASHAAVSLGPAHLVRVEQGSMAGPVADRLMAWTRLGTRVVVTLGPVPRGLKLSLRARPGTPWRLDRIAESCARGVGGAGGGHRLAAGALIANGQEARFLETLSATLKKAAAENAMPIGGEVAR